MEITKASAAALVALSLTVGAAGAYLATHRIHVPTEETTLAVSPAVTGSPVVDRSEAAAAGPATAEAIPAERVPPTVTPRPSGRVAVTPAPSQTVPQLPPAPLPPVAPAPVEPLPAEATPVAPEPIREAEAPLPTVTVPKGPLYDELVVAAESVIGLEVETSVTSERARVEDAVVARVTRDVKVGDRIAIPSGSRVNGEVSMVERGGRLRQRARLGVRFTEIVTPDGTRLPIETDTIFREGSSPEAESAAKIGAGGLAGAIIGGILGGGKGAAIGGSVGAGAGTAAVLTGGRNPATLSPGTPVTVRLQEPVVVTVER